LEEEKKINLIAPPVRRSFTSYLKSYETLPFWLTVITTTLTLVPIFISQQSELLSLFRIIAGGIFILFMPGYTVIQLLFPSREMNFIERIIFSICVSLGMIPMIGLGLYSISIGLTVYSVTLSFAMLIVPLSLAAHYRKFSYANRAYREIVVYHGKS
jgi:uncharacterized membrane protein